MNAYKPNEMLLPIQSSVSWTLNFISHTNEIQIEIANADFQVFVQYI
jgi:hypothetical protein